MVLVSVCVGVCGCGCVWVCGGVCGCGGGFWLACVHCYNYTVVSDELLMMTTLICTSLL